MIARRDARAITNTFHAEHNRLYGYSLEAENAPVEIINLRVNSLGLTDKPQYTEQAFAGVDSAHAVKGERNAYVPETTRFARMPVYDGRRLRHGNRLTGPAIIEEVTTSVFVSGSYDCVVDRYGSFALYQRGREDLAGRTRYSHKHGGSSHEHRPDPALGVRAHLQIDH